MSPVSGGPRCAQAELVCAYALRALPSGDVVGVESHLSSCAQCRRRLARLRPIVDTYLSRPSELLEPPASVQQRLAQRIASDSGMLSAGGRATRQWREPEWEEVAPGISCRLLSTDRERRRVSMLVRLAPGTEYPPHTHAGVEELHLLSGELWIDERKLYAGDYNRAEPGSSDQRVSSETGCTCLLTTSTEDILR